MLRDCPFSKTVWQRIVPHVGWEFYCQPTDVRVWIKNQLQRAPHQLGEMNHWAYHVSIPTLLEPGTLVERCIYKVLELFFARATVL